MRRTDPAPPARRAVLTTAAWATPAAALAVSAPALAASPSCSGAVVFGTGGNYTRTTATTTATAGTAAVPVMGSGGATMTVSFSSVREAGTTMSSNLTPDGTCLQIQHATVGPARGQTLTISFSRPVTGLTFDLEGFTRAAGYSDDAFLTADTGVAFAIGSQGTQVSGGGTPTNPWVTNVNNAGAARPPQAGVRGITFAGSLNSLTLRYFSNRTSGDTQALYLSRMAFATAC